MFNVLCIIQLLDLVINCLVVRSSADVTVEVFYLLEYNAVSPLQSSGQSSWLQMQRSGFDSRRYQIS
jgi:hypothetical protein